MTSPTRTDEPREAVLAAGQLLVARKGFEFTIHELVREAGVALQTFYRYFGSKDHLLIALIANQIDEHCERLRVATASNKDPVGRLRQHLRTTLAPLPKAELARARFIASEHWRLHQLLPEQLASATQPFADLIREELEAGQAKGTLQPRHASLDAWLITRTVMSAVHHFAFFPADWRPAIADEVTEHCIASVGGQVLPVTRLPDGALWSAGLSTEDRIPSALSKRRATTTRRAPRGRATRSGAAPSA